MAVALKKDLEAQINLPYLNIGYSGDYSTLGNLCSDPQRLEASFQIVQRKLETSNAPVRLMIFVHGGLNGETSAALTHLYLEQQLYAAIPDALAFPIFWESGLLDVTGYLLKNTPYGEAFLQRTNATEAVPSTDTDWLHRRTRRTVPVPRPNPRPEAARQARRVELLLRLSGLGAFGRRLWDTMKYQTKNSFSGNATALDRAKEMPGRAFLRQLIALKLEYPERLKVNLLGHSAGAILIGHLLEATATLRREHRGDGREFPERLVDHLILMAPAITYVDFENHVWRNQDLYHDLTLFALQTAYENDSLELLHEVYPATLLYLVSNVFEEQLGARLIGLQRDSDVNAAKTDFRAVRDYLRGNSRVRTVWGPETAQPGLQSGATSHGGFPRDAKTLESIRSVVIVDP